MKNTRALLCVAAMLGCLVASSGTARADSRTGTISKYHLNSAIPGRGVCIQMIPALPNEWACLWKANALYQELSTLLLHGFLLQKPCTVSWSRLDSSGFHVIEVVECSP